MPSSAGLCRGSRRTPLIRGQSPKHRLRGQLLRSRRRCYRPPLEVGGTARRGGDGKFVGAGDQRGGEESATQIGHQDVDQGPDGDLGRAIPGPIIQVRGGPAAIQMPAQVCELQNGPRQVSGQQQGFRVVEDR